jgi:N-acetylneuraminic acid mutarotase
MRRWCRPWPWISRVLLTWTTIAPLPTPHAALGATQVGDGRIYAIGGQGADGQPTAVVEAFAGDSGWRTRAALLTPRAALAAATAAGGRIFAIGGINAAGVVVNTVQAYDPRTNTWQTRSPMPTARQKLAATTGLDDRIYVMRGQGAAPGYLPLATVEAYDPVLDHWTTMPTLPGGGQRIDLAGVADRKGLIYAVGGATTTASAEVDAFDPHVGQWQRLTDLPTPRSGLGAALGRGSSGDLTIYVIGGAAANAGSFLVHALAVETYGAQPFQWPGQIDGAWQAQPEPGNPSCGPGDSGRSRRAHLRDWGA